jgi:hypothetical protein
MDRRTFLNIVLATPVLRLAVEQVARPTPAPQWTQWGGPNRNFQTQATGLKDTWPAVENGVLYTMYGRPGQEVVIAAAVSLLTNLSWSPSTLVETKLCIRDRKSLMAVELG